MKSHPDIFKEAKEKYTIADIWNAVGLEGEPRASCRSPFRDERSPSFSIFDDGKAWHDHATGEGGDVISFLCAAKGITHAEARQWFGERLGIDFHNPPDPSPPTPTPKSIHWPSDTSCADPDVWKRFANLRGYHQGAVEVMVKAGILRFTKAEGADCYVITDSTQRAAEIRRVDGELFRTGSKAYPLRGCDKSWLPGLAMMTGHPNVLITEGASDLLAAIDLYFRYRKSGGTNMWCITAALGASIKRLHGDAVIVLRGRRVRLVPDADDAGKRMSAHFTDMLNRYGCTVDSVILTDGTDLSDNLKSINPTDLFTL